MQANLEDVREWMEEGDRLLAQSWDYLAASEADPAQLDFAREYFSRAAHAYLAGAVDFQRGPQAAHRVGVAADDAAQLIPHLERLFAGTHCLDPAFCEFFYGHLPFPYEQQHACLWYHCGTTERRLQSHRIGSGHA